MALEQVVLFTAGAVGALEAADQQYGYADRNQHGKNARIDLKPVKQARHT